MEINGIEYEIGPKANLFRADLSEANLSKADLRGANLYGAYLTGANLSGANLGWAYLCGADLTGANLSNAYLSEANLSGANLSNANLSEANLSNANLSGANLTGAILPVFKITPDVGNFVGWKKVRGSVILKLEIIGERNSSLVGRKCRTNKAKVLEAYNPDGSICTEKVFSSLYRSKFNYVVGETISEPDYDPDIRIECTRGIHFFMTRAEAESY
jgi:hypothetical protein